MNKEKCALKLVDEITLNLLLFHSKHGYVNETQCYIYTYLVSLVITSVGLLVTEVIFFFEFCLHETAVSIIAAIALASIRKMR